MNKTILTDVDGVLLDWEPAFDAWMAERGYIVEPDCVHKYNIGLRFGIPKEQGKALVREFNESPAIKNLKPLRDAVFWVQYLRKQGWVFRCITSLSLKPDAVQWRKENLEEVFGPGVFDSITCLDTGADKDAELAPWAGSGAWFIEDKIANVNVGEKLGLKTVLVKHGHNSGYVGPTPTVSSWSEIYRLVTDYTAVEPAQ